MNEVNGADEMSLRTQGADLSKRQAKENYQDQ